jgi:hypothetical protein
MLRIRTCCYLLLLISFNGQLISQVRLSTHDSAVELSAGPSAPALISLRGRQQNLWRNSSPEPLPALVERSGARVPLTWHLASSRVESSQVTFVYESRDPHLRLSWQWSAPAKFGPLEHRVKVENLSGVEFWMPVMDSLRLDWQIGAATPLQHFYV